MDTRNSFVLAQESSPVFLEFFKKTGVAGTDRGTLLNRFELDPTKPFAKIYGGCMSATIYPIWVSLRFTLNGKIVVERRLTNGIWSTPEEFVSSWLTMTTVGGSDNALLVKGTQLNGYYLPPRRLAQTCDRMDVVLDSPFGLYNSEIYVAIEQSTNPL